MAPGFKEKLMRYSFNFRYAAMVVAARVAFGVGSDRTDRCCVAEVLARLEAEEFGV